MGFLRPPPFNPSFCAIPDRGLKPKRWKNSYTWRKAEFRIRGHQGSVVEESGLRSRELMAWGVLDGVLKMMERPQEILNQPDRFLSYFVAPPQAIQNLQRAPGRVQFDFAISSRDFPFCTEYLSAVFETLPTYAGNQPAQVKWENSFVSIDGLPSGSSQPPLLSPEANRRQINPDAVRDLIHQLEHVQLELETRKRELIEKEARVSRLEAELKESAAKQNKAIADRDLNIFARQIHVELTAPVGQVQNGLVRMADYFNRAQQLVVLLVGQNRMNAQVQEAMRRVDWDYVQREFPAMFKELCSSVQDVRDLSKDLASGTIERKFSESKQKRQMELSELSWNETQKVEPPVTQS